MPLLNRWICVAITAAILAACGKSQNKSDMPLAFAPADTPYAYANLEPMPQAMIDRWSSQMHEMWPTVMDLYTQLLQDTKALDERNRHIASAIINELKTRDSVEKWREAGFKTDVRMAFYGVGLIPVMRFELNDPLAFKAFIGRMEQNTGEKLTVGKTGDQDYWTFSGKKLQLLMATQGKHLVLTVAPENASDALKQSLLGVTRPEKTLLDAGTLENLAKQKHFSPYGEGFIDFVKLTDRLTAAAAGTDREFAEALELPTGGSDATCKNEYLTLAHKFPRMTMGAEEITPQRMRVTAELELDPALAHDLATTITSAPGTGGPSEGMMDMSFAIPLLKLKDFWIKQADAVVAAPYTCPSLSTLNDQFRELKGKLDTTIPPPFSDLTGFRFTLTKLAPRDKNAKTEVLSTPDVAGKILMGSSNPGAAVAMAQIAAQAMAPSLKSIQFMPDGKPISIPLPDEMTASGYIPPLFAAMSDKAIAVAAGAGEDASLSTYLNAPAATNEAVFMRMHITGAFYRAMGHYIGMMASLSPDTKPTDIELQTKMFGIYEKWLRSAEFTFSATPTGVVMRETIEMN